MRRTRCALLAALLQCLWRASGRALEVEEVFTTSSRRLHLLLPALPFFTSAQQLADLVVEHWMVCLGTRRGRVTTSSEPAAISVATQRGAGWAAHGGWSRCATWVSSRATSRQQNHARARRAGSLQTPCPLPRGCDAMLPHSCDVFTVGSIRPHAREFTLSAGLGLISDEAPVAQRLPAEVLQIIWRIVNARR